MGDRETEGFINPRAASSREVRTAVMALQKELGVDQDGIVGPRTMRAINEIRADSRPFDVRPGAVHVLAPGMKVETNPGLHPDLAARLDGLKASLDAMAERLERGPATGTKDDPVLVKVGRVTVSCPFQQEEWTCSVDLRRVGTGRYVRDQKGRVAQVASMVTDTDGTSRLTVDVVDEEG